MEGAPFSRSRFDDLQRVQEATKSDDHESLEWIVSCLKRNRDLLRPIRRAARALGTAKNAAGGRKRRHPEGDWALVWLTFMCSGTGQVKPTTQSWSVETWRRCGFRIVKYPKGGDSRPCYRTVLNRFAELQAITGTFETASAAIIERCTRELPDIGRAVVIDGTASFTSSKPIHACHLAGARCRHECDGDQFVRLATKAEYLKAHHEEDRSDVSKIEAKRNAEKKARLDADALRDRWDIDFTRQLSAEQDERGREEKRAGVDGGGIRTNRDLNRYRNYSFFEQNGHLMASADPDAGMRMYSHADRTTKKFWFGYHLIVISCALTGLPLSITVSPADQNESTAFEETFSKLKGTRGRWPQYLAADRGFGFRNVISTCLSAGTDPVIPVRRYGERATTADYETEDIDRDGVLRCRSCGGPCAVRRPQDHQNASWDATRVFATCSHRLPECPRGAQVFDLTDRDAFRVARFVDLRHAAPHQARLRLKTLEHTHHDRQRRYACGATEWSQRNRIGGQQRQELVAASTVLLDWLRFACRFGILRRPKTKKPSRTVTIVDVAPSTSFETVLATRNELALDLPRGPRAAALGVPLFTPPG